MRILAEERTNARRLARAARVPALCCLCGPTFAQSEIINRIQSGIDSVAHGMDYVGQKAGDLLGPGYVEEQQAAHTETRQFNETYPVGPTPVVAISSQFGEIRVGTWDDRIVQVNATISAGADNAELAATLAQGIQTQVEHTEELVAVHTVFPETRPDTGYVNMTVNYTITIPKSASLMADNFFGDTFVKGTAGAKSTSPRRWGRPATIDTESS